MIFFFLCIVVMIYVITIAQLIVGWGRIQPFVSKSKAPTTFFSIIVPFRNESRNLPAFLESIKQLNYPVTLFELIFVDDFSEDDSTRKIYDWRMQNGTFQTTLLENIRLSKSPKKDAISRAVPIIQQQWLITTDADCTVPGDWLTTLDRYIVAHDVVMVAGPVACNGRKSFLRHFQHLDLTSLQGATIGSFGIGLPFMCNGANLCYTKSLFQELHGFAGNKQIASGDDVFLLQKAAAKYPGKVHFLKSREMIVHTEPEKSWTALFQQRLRWASKTSSYQSLFGKDLAVVVLAGNLSLVIAFGLAAAGQLPAMGLLVLFSLKFIPDYMLLWRTHRFLSSKRMRFVLLSSLVYPFFCVVVAVCSWFVKYQWKGRSLR